MHNLLLVTLLFFLSFSLLGQNKAERYVDVVFRHNAPPLEGNILSYTYNERVVIVQRDGSVKEVPWKNVKRVNYRYDKRSVPKINLDRVAEEAAVEEKVLPTPERKTRHQVTSTLTFGRSTNNDFGFLRSSTAIGAGLAYHLLREVSFFTAGAGLDLNLMNHQRQENVLAATVLLEVPLGNGRWRPFARMETGPSIPFGGEEDNEEITSRAVTFLYHPAVGVEITPRNGGWGKMTLDLGYRFLNSRFNLTTTNLDVVERVVNYRRLTLRGGMRF